MPRFKKGRRTSKLQKVIVRSLKTGSMNYEDLRETVMAEMKIDYDKEESFKASFSRSLKNLAEKRLIQRAEKGWYLARISLLWETIKLTKRGMTQSVTYCE